MRLFFLLLSIAFFAIMCVGYTELIKQVYFGLACVVTAGVSLFYPEIEAREFE